MIQFGNIANSGKAKISSPFGPRNIGPGKSKNHKGIDLSYPSGTQLTSPLDGVVERADTDAGKCGGLLVINHGNFNGKNVKTKYCHLKRIDVNNGDKLKKGEVVGLSGGDRNDIGRGNSTGPHVHFEVLENGVQVNPAPYYQNSITGDQSKVELGKDEISKTVGDVSKYDDEDDESEGNNSENKTKDIAMDIVKKVLGIESILSDENVVSEIKDELEKFNYLIKEQVLVVDNQKIENTSEGTFYRGSINSVVKSVDKGKLEKLSNTGLYNVGIKIGGTEMFWNGSLNEGLTDINGLGTPIGRTTDGIVFTRTSSSSPNSQNKVNSTTKQQTNNNTSTTQTKTSDTTDKDQGSKDIVQGVVKQLFKQNESIVNSENILNEEINRIKNLIK